MNELQVIVRQTPGVITWNYEDLRAALKAQMDEYKSIVYTDDNVDDARKDVAKLRALRKAVNDRKIEIKNNCLEPYKIIEAQAKELMGLIDEPIELISQNVTVYETNRKATQRKLIESLMRQKFSDLPQQVSKKLISKTYDSRWENKTAKQKEWEEAIQKAHDDTVSALQIIGNVDEDFMDEVMKEYLKDLSVTDALRHAQYLQKQKEIVLERERQRREAEARRAEEERRRQEEDLVRREQQEKADAERKKTDSEQHEEHGSVDEQVRSIVNEERQKTKEQVNRIIAEQKEADIQNPPRTILFHGTDAQLSKVLGYINFIGARYELR